MKKILRGFWIVCSVVLCSHTLFEKTIGNHDCYDEGISVIPLESGGWLVSGAYNCNGNPQSWKSSMLTLSVSGDSLSFHKELPFNGIMKTTMDGNLIFAGGNRAGFVYDTARIFKVSLEGQVLWQSSLFDSLPNHLLTDIFPFEAGYLITGIYTKGLGSSPYDSYVAKLNPAGGVVWIHREDGEGNEQFHSVKRLSDKTVAAFGWIEAKTSANDADYFLIKLDTDGSLIWSKTFGDDRNNFGYGFDITNDGGFILNGYSQSMDAIRLDADGEVIWETSLANACGGRYFKVKTYNSGFVFLGTSRTGSGHCHSVLIKTDTAGNAIWTKDFNGTIREFYSDDSEHFALTGYTSYPSQLFVVGFDSLETKIEDTTEVPTALGRDIVSEAGVKVYPNPAERFFTIRFENELSEKHTFELLNISGKSCLVIENINAGEVMIDRAELPAGIFIYRITGTEKIYSGKLIFQ